MSQVSGDGAEKRRYIRAGSIVSPSMASSRARLSALGFQSATVPSGLIAAKLGPAYFETA